MAKQPRQKIKKENALFNKKEKQEKTLFKRKVKRERTPAELRLRKQRQLKYIAALPTAVTLMNAFFGFLSIIFANKAPGIVIEVFLFRKAGITNYTLAAYLIVFAMIADALDGQVARWSGAASAFGGQLDSLSDVISFGVAPAFLMFNLLKGDLNQLTENLVLFAAVFYVLCAVIRLARFNVENSTDLSSHQHFTGLPSPAAAGVVISLVIFLEDYLPKIQTVIPGWSLLLLNICRSILPFTALVCGILMVTRIQYPHLSNRLLKGQKSFVTVLLVLFVVFLAIWHIQLALLFGFWGFALIGLIKSISWGIGKITTKRYNIKKEV